MACHARFSIPYACWGKVMPDYSRRKDRHVKNHITQKIPEKETSVIPRFFSGIYFRIDGLLPETPDPVDQGIVVNVVRYILSHLIGHMAVFLHDGKNRFLEAGDLSFLVSLVKRRIGRSL